MRRAASTDTCKTNLYSVDVRPEDVWILVTLCWQHAGAASVRVITLCAEHALLGLPCSSAGAHQGWRPTLAPPQRRSREASPHCQGADSTAG